jgi:hypothetical protein
MPETPMLPTRTYRSYRMLRRIIAPRPRLARRSPLPPSRVHLPSRIVCVCSGDDATLCRSSICNCNPASKACVVQTRSDDTVCSCGAANVCVKGSCHVDSDCGAGGYCSPAIDVCNRFFGYYCHMPADECSDETDCPPSDQRICTPAAATTGGDSTNTKWICSAASSCP